MTYVNTSFKLYIAILGLSLISVVLQPLQVRCQDSSAAAAAAASSDDGSDSGSAAAAAASSGSRSASLDSGNSDSSVKLSSMSDKKNLVDDVFQCTADIINGVLEGKIVIPPKCCKLPILTNLPACSKKQTSGEHTKKPRKKPGSKKVVHTDEE